MPKELIQTKTLERYEVTLNDKRGNKHTATYNVHAPDSYRAKVEAWRCHRGLEFKSADGEFPPLHRNPTARRIPEASPRV